MPVATITFRRCLVNASACESDEDHVGSRVFFDLNIEGQAFGNVYVDVRQVIREGAEHEPLVVTPPQGYDGPFNFRVFQGLVAFYYRQAVGGTWGMGGMQGLGRRLKDWAIEQEMRVEFEVDDGEAGTGTT